MTVRVRPVDANNDDTLGVPFLADSPEAVALLVYARLGLWQAEWFADLTDGTAYFTGVLGERYAKNPDAVIKQRILGTPGAVALTGYNSAFNGGTRLLTVAGQLQTQFSATPVQLNIPLGPL